MLYDERPVNINQALQTGAAHYEAGRYADAGNIFRQILALQPNHPDALYLMGVLAHAMGRGDVAEEVIGRSIMEITVAKGTKQEAEQHLRELREGQRCTGEFEVRCKGGRFLTALVTLSPIRDESGATTGIIGVSQDLSGGKRTEAELRT